MTLYRRKPLIVEAEQYRNAGWWPRGICGCEEGDGIAHVHSMHGDVILFPEHGDWVVREPGSEGHFYLIPDAQFAAEHDLLPP